MVLIDASVWVEFIRFGNQRLRQLLVQGRVLMHDVVIGEVAWGTVPGRAERLVTMGELIKLDVAQHSEVQMFVDKHRLFESRLGYVDNHLLASVALMPGCTLWSRDKKLQTAAQRLGCSFQELAH